MKRQHQHQQQKIQIQPQIDKRALGRLLYFHVSNDMMTQLRCVHFVSTELNSSNSYTLASKMKMKIHAGKHAKQRNDEQKKRQEKETHRLEIPLFRNKEKKKAYTLLRIRIESSVIIEFPRYTTERR